MHSFLSFVEIGAFISSALAWNKIKHSTYMRLFPFLLFLISFGELFGYYLAVKYRNNLWFYNLLDPVIFVLYFFIFLFAIKNKAFKKVISGSIIVYIIISSVTYFQSVYGNVSFNNWMYISGTILLIICILRKLYELIEDSLAPDFIKSPFFYILIFTLLFYTVTIPNFAMDNWMANSKMSKLTAIVNNVSDFLNILLYAVYSIAFLWIRKTVTY